MFFPAFRQIFSFSLVILFLFAFQWHNQDLIHVTGFLIDILSLLKVVGKNIFTSETRHGQHLHPSPAGETPKLDLNPILKWGFKDSNGGSPVCYFFWDKTLNIALALPLNYCSSPACDCQLQQLTDYTAEGAPCDPPVHFQVWDMWENPLLIESLLLSLSHCNVKCKTSVWEKTKQNKHDVLTCAAELSASYWNGMLLNLSNWTHHFLVQDMYRLL